MRDTRTIHGQGVLVCGDEHATAVYRIDLFSDALSNKNARGFLQIDTAFAFKAALAVKCRLILKDGTENGSARYSHPSRRSYPEQRPDS